MVAAVGFDADVVLPGLYIGSISSTTDLEALKKNQITHILTILHNDIRNKFTDDIVYKWIQAVDDETTNMLDYLEDALSFIDDARAKGGSVLVHCHAGMSRSGSVVIGLVMRDKQICFKEAWAFVTCGRSIVRPIEHFRQQLTIYEKCGFKVDKNHPEYIQFWKEHKLQSSLAHLNQDSTLSSVTSSLSASFVALAGSFSGSEQDQKSADTKEQQTLEQKPEQGLEQKPEQIPEQKPEQGLEQIPEQKPDQQKLEPDPQNPENCPNQNPEHQPEPEPQHQQKPDQTSEQSCLS